MGENTFFKLLDIAILHVRTSKFTNPAVIVHLVECARAIVVKQVQCIRTPTGTPCYLATTGCDGFQELLVQSSFLWKTVCTSITVLEY